MKKVKESGSGGTSEKNSQRKERVKSVSIDEPKVMNDAILIELNFHNDDYGFHKTVELVSEVEHLQDFGIPYEIIPGISSSTGAATLNGIPLTKRGINQSFWVLTATTKDGSLSNDLTLAAQSTATSVILMGTKKVKDISELYCSKGKENTPVAFIENASMPDERIILTIVKKMGVTASKEALKSPAIILIGEVVARHYFANRL